MHFTIQSLDHLVLTVADVDSSCQFYQRVLGMKLIVFGEGRKALGFGQQKLNLHTHGAEFEPKAKAPTPGSADICLITEAPIDTVIAHLAANQVDVIEGPVARTGAIGPITSVYFRDPDNNLVEVARYD